MKTSIAPACPDAPTTLNDRERARQAGNAVEPGGAGCGIELYLGCFFDGTRNHRENAIARGDHTESNVGRLFDAFNKDIDRRYSARLHRFASYIQGVGTEARDKTGDSGTGWHARAGAAAGWGGEGRINWMLMEVQDLLIRHFSGSTLTEAMGFKETPPIVKRMSADMRLTLQDVERLAKAANLPLANYLAVNQGDAEIALRNSLSGGFWNTINALRRVRGTHLTRADHAARRQVLQERRHFLAGQVAPFQQQNPRVDRIRLSVFGFSRGATEARVFCNWLADACDPGEGPLRLCGIPVQVDFVGLFDTVASVGAAQSFFEDVFAGHGGWAAAEDLRIPADVRRCVHMVAAHEVRGSFPLDLVEGANCEQIVYPGAHSDVGGGYAPGEQGKSPIDAEKLSQVPLCHMYREAVAAGVPLLRLEQMPVGRLRSYFNVAPTLRRDFNAYLQAMAPFTAGITTSGRAERTATLMYAHYRQYLLWRRQHLDAYSALPSFQRAAPQDRADLLGANDELRREAQGMKYNNATARTRTELAEPTQAHGMLTPPPFLGIPSVDFVQMKLRGHKERQWLDAHIGTLWESGQVPPAAVAALLDGYVHDSRAWFKPFGLDDDEWLFAQRRERDHHQARMRELDKRETAYQSRRRLEQAAGRLFASREPLPMTTAELEELTAWRRDPDRTGQALQRVGREYYWQWGYLRWRTCYPSHPGESIAEQATRRGPVMSTHAA